MILPYTGLGELNAQLTEEKQKVSTEEKKLKQKIKQQDDKDLKEINKQKQELANLVASAEFSKVFKSYYGDAYDENAINKTVKISMDSGFSPKVTYTVKNFNVRKDFLNHRKSFNQNTNIKEILGSSQDFTSLNTMNNVAENTLEKPGDIKQSVLSDILDDDRELYPFEKKEPLIEPDQVYKEAETLFIKQYEEQYKKRLKPKIKSKYGLDV